jgi:metal-responsive CopG/Arc/MetJ family transcriptional regulator
MGANTDKTKFSIRVDTELLKLCDEYIQKTDVLNRTEFIETALKFYVGYLTSKNIEDYLLQSMSSVLTGTVQDSENRLARMAFKMAVEISKLAQVIAYSHNVDEASMQKLHVKCLVEVKRINGAVKFEDAYKYQKRND